MDALAIEYRCEIVRSNVLITAFIRFFIEGYALKGSLLHV
jgi:hypothetical protein